jgi:PAS domain S-box-containing protein
VLVFRDQTQERQAQRAILEQNNKLALLLETMKQAEADIALNQARLQLALNAAKAGIWEWDLRTNENTWSEELWALYGLTPHCCKPSYEAWLQSIHPEDRELTGTTVQRASSQGVELYVEWRVNNPGSPLRWLMSRGQPVCDETGQVISYRGIVIDITERKHSEKMIHERNEQYRSLFENTHAVMLLIDPNGGAIVDANPAATQFYGWTHDELIQKNVADINTLTPEEIHREMQAARDMQRNYFLFRHRRADGSTSDVEVYSGPILVRGCKLLYSIVHDITQRKQAEERIKTLLDEKEILLKEVHHRIKNNMNIVSSLLHLQMNVQQDLSAKNALQDAASRLQSMMVLYDKLYLSVNFKDVSMKDYIPPLLEEITGIFPQNGSIKIKTQIDDVRLDAKLLSTLGIILNELTTNAMKHAFTGQKDGEITVVATRKANCVSILFADNGVGLPASLTTQNSPGFGMQLVDMLVKQIRGSISIDRVQGTRYRIEFEAE